MSKLDRIALSDVVYRVKTLIPAQLEPCGTSYESVTLSDRVSLIFTDRCLFFKQEKNQI